MQQQKDLHTHPARDSERSHMHEVLLSRRDEAHAHTHSGDAPQPHAHNHATWPTRRNFLGSVGAVAGAALLETSLIRAAKARVLAAQYSGHEQLFDIERVADGVFAALAQPQALINSNAAIFVGANDVLVVDAHSKPSAAAALIAQLRREVTKLPVRYLVNSHFHWDHVQGNSAYREAFPELRFVASRATHDLMAENTVKRLKESQIVGSLNDAAKLLEQHRAALAKSHDAAERAFHQGQIEQIAAYEREMKDFSLELPQVVFDDGITLGEGSSKLVLTFHGRAHTAGDVTVFSPEKKAIATGDMLHGFPPYIADAYPKEWPATLHKVGELPFTRVIGGHGPVQHDRIRLTHMAGYIEELADRVARGRQEGKSLAELQQSITLASLPSLNSDSYADLVRAALKRYEPWYGTPPSVEDAIKTNVEEVWNRWEA
jgi:glyoxylase-like metal-dependent hydrolase (beta-lactamase superfamily II)